MPTFGNLGASEMTPILAPSNYSELHERVSEALGPCRRPILIGFDGRDHNGKTSAANWLAWQLGMPAIHLDLFYQPSESESAISWRADDLARCLKARSAKPIIVEAFAANVLGSRIAAAPSLPYPPKYSVNLRK
jgi:hypothetical protein